MNDDLISDIENKRKTHQEGNNESQDTFYTKKEKNQLMRKEKRLNKLRKKKSQIIEEQLNKVEKEVCPVVQEVKEVQDNKEEIEKEVYPIVQEVKEVQNNKGEINIIGILMSGFDVIRDKIKERDAMWIIKKEKMSQDLLVEYDSNFSGKIINLILKGRKATENLGASYKGIQPIIRGIFTACEKENEKITRKHKKEIKLEKSICYKCKNKALKKLGTTHKKKEYMIKNVNHKTTKKKLEIKKMANLLGKTDFLNRSKLWIIKFNLMKEKFKSKKEVTSYPMEDTENNLKRKFKNEKNYKMIKLIKQKRKNPIRKAQINHLIKEYKRSTVIFQKHKKIMDKKYELTKMYSVTVLDRDAYYYTNQRLADTGYFSIVDRSYSPIFYTEEQINLMNQLLETCYLISIKNNTSVLDIQIKAPDIDTDDRLGPNGIY